MARRIVLDQERAPDPDRSEVDYRSHLNDRQYAAVTVDGGRTLIIAGAGTGKTRTLVYRVAYLVECGIPPGEIVLLTFTRRASREMLDRAADLLDERCERVQGGTFHAFCNRLLRRYAPRIDFPSSFTILDAADVADVLDILRARRNLHESEKRFPRKGLLQSLFSRSVNTQRALSEIVQEEYSAYADRIEELTALRDAYRRYKRENGLMDYDDLLLRSLELLEDHPDLRRSVATGCRHVLVDEYQDTNSLQADLARTISAVHENLTVVGDDAQSIYGFRGADFRNIRRFPEEYDGVELIKLEQNYRSTQPILDLANRLIDRAPSSFKKELFTRKEGGERPLLVEAPDDRDESRFVAQQVLRLREEGVSLGDVAVLFRRGSDSYALESELDRRGIPFVKYGGVKFTETAHVKDLLGFLKVAENRRDEVAWNRVLQLIRGIGPKTARAIIETLWSIEPYYEFAEHHRNDRYVERLEKLSAVYRRLENGALELGAQIELITEFYRELLPDVYPEDHDERREDLERFRHLAENFGDRTELLSRLTLDPIELSRSRPGGSQLDEPPLVLSTIHSAKGLEFDAVFVIQVVDGTIPSSQALDRAGELEEELRLLYVAVTRARRELYLSHPVVQGGRKGEYFTRPSRFVRDLPEEVLEPAVLVEEPEEASSDGE